MIDCVILAAGYATRLYPITENFPKPLLKVAGRSIIDRLLDDLEQGSEVVSYTVVSNHKFYQKFVNWAKSRSEQIRIIDDGTTDNDHRLGAVKDMQLAQRSLTDHADDQHMNSGDNGVLVMAGDNVLDFSLQSFIDFARKKDTSCVMCFEEPDPQRRHKTAIITVDDENRITSYEEKPDQPKGSLAVPPFYYYKKKDFIRIDEALESGCGYDAPGSFAAWLSFKTTMHAWLMTGKRYDIGDLESYRRAQELFGI